MKISVILCLLLLLTASFCSAEEQPKSWQPEIRVGVMNNVKTVVIAANMDCFFFAGNKKEKIFRGEVFAISLNGENIKLKEKIFPGGSWDIRPDDPRELKNLVLKINGKAYRGGLRLLRKGEALTVVNTLPAEEYLRGVVPEEMPPLWAKEALKAQTVAARTFALKNRKRHEKDGYDMCMTTHCQVYAGASKEHINTDTAIRETYGEVLFAAPNGPIIDTPFHTDSGGMTENNEEIWGRGIPYLRAVKEPVEKTKPWTKVVSLWEFGKKSGVADVKKIELSDLTIGKSANDRTKSGRVKSVKIIGAANEKTFTGLELRNMFNLNSTLFDMKLAKKGVEFAGFGIGHGIGMSQWGAKTLAESGKTYKEILEHYYKKTFIKKLY